MSQPGESRHAAPGLVVVANRLPMEQVDDTWRRSPGGLVSALEPVLGDRPSTWVGWAGPGTTREAPGAMRSCRLVEVALESADVSDYYEGFSNSAIWPLYHDGIVTPAYHRHHFEAYRRVNARFAENAAASAAPGATVWIHDYHLQLVPAMLRRLRPDLRLGFFLHIPFPPVELFLQLPWRRQVLEGLLGADLIGFQTPDGARNFVQLCRRILGIQPDESGRLPVGRRRVTAAAFPIGIDAASFSRLAADPAVRRRAAEIRAELGQPRSLLLGVDRLDYTKGIDIRIKAFTELLTEGRIEDMTAVLVQVAVPSRENVDEYQRIRDEVDKLVGRANGDLSRLGFPAIHYLHQPLDREELVALYVAADIMLVTPLRDGMNLVCKEYVACRNDDSGVLVLSEFTGAATQLDGALLVNPYDTEGVEQAIRDAVLLSADEQQRRMSRLRQGVFVDDVDAWATAFLATLESRREGAAA